MDNAEAGRSLARYIGGLGHRRIAMISARTTNNDRAQARQRGVLEVLDALGCAPPPPWHLHVRYRLDEARDAMRALLGRDERPTAVICGNDVLAYGALLEAVRENVRVPEDLSIAGFDDLEWSRHLQPTLTTIHMPTDEIWVRAGRYLVDRLDARESLLHQKVEFSLIVRESTAALLVDEIVHRCLAAHSVGRVDLSCKSADGHGDADPFLIAFDVGVELGQLAFLAV